MPSEKKKPADKELDKKSTDKASILSPDKLKEYADTFERLAKDFRDTPDRYSEIGHLETARERNENQAGRNMMEVIRGDSKGLWHALADCLKPVKHNDADEASDKKAILDRLKMSLDDAAQRADEASDDVDEASYFWKHIATAWLRGQKPQRFKGNAGRFDLPRPRRDKKGRLIPKSGVVVVVADSSGKETIYDDDEAGGIQTVYRGDEAALKRLGVKTKGGRGRVLAKDHLACARIVAEDNADHCEVMADIILDEVKRRESAEVKPPAGKGEELLTADDSKEALLSPKQIAKRFNLPLPALKKRLKRPVDSLGENDWLSARGFADYFHLPEKTAGAMRKALINWKAGDPDATEGTNWRKDTKKGPRDSQYSFRVGAVRHILRKYVTR